MLLVLFTHILIKYQSLENKSIRNNNKSEECCDEQYSERQEGKGKIAIFPIKKWPVLRKKHHTENSIKEGLNG